MKRMMIGILTVAMLLSCCGLFAFAADEPEAAPENPEELEVLLSGLDYELYVAESVNYGEETAEPYESDEEMALLYSSEGYGLLCDLAFGDVVVLRFDPETSTVEGEGETVDYTVEDASMTLTDSDGWSVVFHLYEPGLEQYIVRLLLESRTA